MLGSLKMVNIDLTNRCNLNCKHCGIKNSNSRFVDELNKGQIIHLLEEIAEMKCRDVTFADVI